MEYGGSIVPLTDGVPDMAKMIVFHHAQGCTKGVHAFADALRLGGNTVHVPDLYDGRTFDNLDDGLAYAADVGFATLVERGVHAAEGLPAGMVCSGFSRGALPAQKLAQTRVGALGALT
jgi:dienelactone hydrolase